MLRGISSFIAKYIKFSKTIFHIIIFLEKNKEIFTSVLGKRLMSGNRSANTFTEI